MAKNLEDNGIKLAFGETVKEVAGDGKVEKIITDKNEYDVDMVILAVGFRPNTAFAGEGIERFRNGAFLVNKRQKLQSQAFTLLVTVQQFTTTLLATQATSHWLQTRYVLVS